jgi:hypothetical protein
MASSTSHRIPRVYVAAVGFVAGLIVASALWAGGRLIMASPKLDLGAAFHAILLTGGQAYFGRIGERGPPYLVLDEVYYIQSTVNRTTNETTNRLIKRGSEPHGPSRMYINAEHVLFIEPVGTDSTVGRMIAEAQRPK